MSFNDDVTLDTSGVRTGGGRRGAAIGGGLGGFGLVAAVIFYLVTGQFPNLGSEVSAPVNDRPATDIAAECRTGADANSSDRCRMVAGKNSLDQFWNAQLASEAGLKYYAPTLNLYSGQVATACGTGSNAVGPFYCPGDQTIYIDTTFFDQLKRFGADNTSLAQLYILAHEWGHHIQNHTGDLQKIDHNSSGPTSSMVRSELQADCLAGAWMHNASTVKDPDTGIPFMKQPTAEQISSALNAAAAVGDDRIAQKAGMNANPDNFSHGSSAKRAEWLERGLENGTLEACNTWAVDRP
ncbi:putative metalloprotease [Arcanobacterium wilhelmae]|uniref:Metalloprotease n=1 Tax=Arcanobacterium wilhelmae TaxID=1803177 RepID=A0ABT9N8B0_9ACTO|nr:neutral zinc metallopeptidase [Arcanobacterium wilhelmae]MDP9799946.1 putative metalloprotease [Arcanobacterium wilhelmae]WFN91080.1 neutral zinc metallopeptidase [Arcanobacterium wilhelmae]